MIKLVEPLKTVSKFVIFFLFTYSFSYSQNNESLKKLDTIYIYFKNCSKYEVKNVYSPSGSKIFTNEISYLFKIDFYNTINFLSADYYDYDLYKKGIKNDVKIVKKSFLEVHKKEILDIDFFIENGFKETFFTIYGKVIYVIDKDEIKNGKVILKQVNMMNHTFFEE